MNALIERLRKNGISISLKGGAGLSAKPLNLLTEKDKNQIAQQKKDLIEYLQSVPEDPALLVLKQLGCTVCYVMDDETAKLRVQELVDMGQVVFGLDIETYGPSQRQGKVLFKGGLDPHMGRIRSIQIAAPGHYVVVFDLAMIDSNLLLPLMQGPGTFVAYNAGFEYAFLKKMNLAPQRLGCAMMMSRLAFGLGKKGNKHNSLSEVTQRVLGIEISKEVRDSDWSVAGPLSKGQIHYGALDAVLAMELVKPLTRELRESGQGRIYQLISRALPVVHDAMLNGIGFNVQEHRRLIGVWNQEVNEAAAEISSSVPSIRNPNSTQQLCQWLEQTLPADIQKNWPRTETGRLQTGTDALSEWPECPDALMRYKEFNKLSTTYGAGWADHIHPVTGRLHAHFSLMGTRGGRFSCSRPNIQNPPRNSDFRSLFIPTEGYEFVVADFSQIELRVCAILAEDETMQQAYREGIDLHRLTAAHAAGCALEEVSDEQRQAAKAINFGLIYGMSAPTLVVYSWTSYRVRITLEQAEIFRQSFFDNYRGIARWHQSVKRRGEWDQTVRTQTGLLRDMSQETNGWRFTNACNTPVQGSAAEVLLASLARLPKALQGLEARLVNHVHDEILIECRSEEVDQTKLALMEAMTKGFLEVFPAHADMTRDLVESKSGSNWFVAKQCEG